MKGIEMDEFRELISYWHEAEFEYRNREYILQPEYADGKCWLVIWECAEEGGCICRYEMPEHRDIPQEIIQKVLEEKCFDGQSFLDIEREVTVTMIF